MIIFLSELQKQHLALIHQHSAQVLIDFCKLSIDFLINGANAKKYNIAAEKLGVSVDTVKNLVHALVYLVLEGCKHNLSENDYKSSLVLAGFSSDHQDILLKLFATKRLELAEALHLLQQRDPTYQNLSWRFEVQISSRNLDEQIKPIVTLDFALMVPKNYGSEDETKENGSNQNNIISPDYINSTIHDAKAASHCQYIINHILLQCDLSNLVHLTNKLDQALTESKSQHVRKIQRVLLQ